MKVFPALCDSHYKLPAVKPFGRNGQFLFVIGLILSSPGIAQQHDAQMSHDPANTAHAEVSHAMSIEAQTSTENAIPAQAESLPVQGGQSAFAAIAEIVAILDNDPDTDWESVNIDALRSHLVDMDRITLNVKASTLQVDEQRIKYVITGTGDTLTAIRNMVPAHAKVVQSMTNWTITTTEQSDGVTVSIQTSDKAALTRLKALGFHGFLTVGAHHQAHHLQMARGVGH